MAESAAGIIFGIQHFSIDDGPGIRTTVFLKGCNMRCVWCHNPESISRKPELMYHGAKCAMCGGCAAVCPEGAHRLENGFHRMDRELCVACGKCVEVCAAEALTVAGRMAYPGEIVAEAQKDMRYYRKSGGGLTIGGGEPSCQPGFTRDIARMANEAGIGVAIETNGAAGFEFYESLLPYICLFLIDYKLTNPEAHRVYTGIGKDKVLESIKRLDAAEASIALRCPIIPGINDNEEHFRGIAELTKKHASIIGFELMPYHKLGASKAKRLGTDMRTFEEPNSQITEAWKKEIAAYGGREWRR